MSRSIGQVRAAQARAQARVAADLPGDRERAVMTLRRHTTELRRLEQRCVCNAPRYEGHDRCGFCATREGASS